MRTFRLNPCTAFLASAAMVMVVSIPAPAGTTDDRIEASAKSSYNFKTYLRNDNIRVQSSRGKVTLTGTVSQDYHKALAEETVSGLPGVKAVNNQLSLVGEEVAEHSDAWVNAKVKAALSFHRNVSAIETTVRTQDGVVTLTGKADSVAQKELTGEYARDVEGVLEVHNELAVSGTPASRRLEEKVDDASITAQVRTALLFHKSTHVLATKVVTRNGVVTVRGQAKNAAERELVSKLAEDIHGVRRVRNLMTAL